MNQEEIQIKHSNMCFSLNLFYLFRNIINLNARKSLTVTGARSYIFTSPGMYSKEGRTPFGGLKALALVVSGKKKYTYI
jgi:hypothetical protein